MDAIKAVTIFIYAVLAALAGAVIGALGMHRPGVRRVYYRCVKVLFTHPEGLPERAHAFTVPAGGDPAKPNYFYGPARSDLRYIWQVTRSRWQDASEWWQNTVGGLWDVDEASQALTRPIAGGLAVGLVVALPLAAILMGAAWLANEMLLDFATVSVRCTVTTLRAIDNGLLSVQHIQVRCISCFERIPYPAYLCPT